MVHAHGYVVAIKDDRGQVLRESSKREVFLPEDSHYSILLKNKSRNRSVVDVEIDGMDALGGKQLIIPAFGDLNLERFVLDGDLTRGRKFKFVSADHHDVIDPSSPKNGEIKVTFWEEINPPTPNLGIITPEKPRPRPIKKPTFPYDPIDPWNPHNPWNPWDRGPYFYTCKSDGSKSFCSTRGTEIINNYSDNVGATVEGNYSRQRFNECEIGDLSRSATVIKIYLRLHGSYITTKDTKRIEPKPYVIVDGRKYVLDED